MHAISDTRITSADVPPHIIRQVMHLIRDRGYTPERLCKGLGFTLDDLQNKDFRVSYRQTSTIIRRAMRLLNDPSIGIATGSRQTIASFGLPGLGMLTCRTLGDAFQYGIKYQIQAGSIAQVDYSADERRFVIEASMRFYDPELEPFFVEEILVSGVAMTRALVGERYQPLRVELRYPRPSHAVEYGRFFNCPVSFGASANRIISDRFWHDIVLRTYDEFMMQSLQESIDQLLGREKPHDELIESILTVLRASIDETPRFDEVARLLNFSERTLRRRLTGLNVSFQSLIDRARYEYSLDLLERTRLPLNQIAMATGFSDSRTFRRAFKRWSGKVPNQMRAPGTADALAHSHDPERRALNGSRD
ncbi:AraC family transcriptional regulator ligand-binding domain-containing protein [Paraburkholderia madseniana]|nr:AraC family transcriptional regulator ligand-binding domain-containing protein [Paraburkholderia madseniana]